MNANNLLPIFSIKPISRHLSSVASLRDAAPPIGMYGEMVDVIGSNNGAQFYHINNGIRTYNPGTAQSLTMTRPDELRSTRSEILMIAGGVAGGVATVTFGILTLGMGFIATGVVAVLLIGSGVLGILSGIAGISATFAESLGHHDLSDTLTRISLGFGIGSALLMLAGGGIFHAMRIGHLLSRISSLLIRTRSFVSRIPSILGRAGATLSGRSTVSRIPSTMYRGDLRRLSEIERAGGFRGIGKNTSIEMHLSGRNAHYSDAPVSKSAYSSFSASERTAISFVEQRFATTNSTSVGYIYEIKKSGAKFFDPTQRIINTKSNLALIERSRMQQEFLSKHAPFENITSYKYITGWL